jgi:hypothetical protein
MNRRNREGGPVIFPAAPMDAVTERMTSFAVFVSAAAAVLLTAVAVASANALEWIPVVLLVAAAGAAFLFCYNYAPRSYELADEWLMVHRSRLIRPAHVSLREIQTARRPTIIEQSLKNLHTRPLTVALMGGGGFLCLVGWYWTKGEGIYWISTRNIEKLVMLEGEKKDEGGRRKEEGGSGKAEEGRRSAFISHTSSSRRRIVIGPEDPDRFIQAVEARISVRL